jgi:5-methylcytosine-specific restriction endonuclease McrA
VNPKFAGKPWMIEGKNANSWGSKKAKKARRRKRKIARKYDNPHAKEVRELLPLFWKKFEALPNTAMRLELLQRTSRPHWRRVSDDLRKRLRRQFAAKYPFLLANIDEYCGACGDGVWKEKHHIIPLSHGGINEDLNLIAICKKCHDEIHPWMKSTA